jgi:hypothetical protein
MQGLARIANETVQNVSRSCAGEADPSDDPLALGMVIAVVVMPCLVFGAVWLEKIKIGGRR